MEDFKKYGNKKKLIENLKLSWESLSLFERDKEYSPSSVIGGDYTPFINKYLSESKLARSHVNSKIYNYGKKDNQIIEIDKRNPILSSRLAKTFSRWRNYTNLYQNSMYDAIKRIYTSHLSNNLREVLELSI